MHLKHVITVEGLGTFKNMHPVQAAIANANGSQCGFCTPGIVMSLYGELHNNPRPTVESIEDAFDGNLCRCTGYRPILEGARRLIACQDDCATCPKASVCADLKDVNGDFKYMKFRKVVFVMQKELGFPPKLLEYHQSRGRSADSFLFTSGRFKWSHPSTIEQLLELKHEFPQAKIINGNTEIGIEMRFKNQPWNEQIHVSDIKELKVTNVLEEGVEFGAATTLTSLREQLERFCETMSESKSKGFRAMLDNLKYFAGRQVRNVSAIAGNICTASPISDLNPVLVSLGAVLTVKSKRSGSRKIPMTEFFLGYRRTALDPTEVVVSIFVPFTKETEHVSAFKQAKRRDDDIAIANAGFRISVEKEGSSYIVKDASFAYGGMGPTTVSAIKTANALIGKKWEAGIDKFVVPLLLEEFNMKASAPGGQVQFRKTLLQSFFIKFMLRVNNALPSIYVDHRNLSALNEIPRGISSGTLRFQESSGTGVVGKSVVHLAADKQVTGEAQYVDDIPKLSGELYGAILYSPVANGKLVKDEEYDNCDVPGVVGYVSWRDTNHNIIGPVVHDEELFATDTVHHVGQMIGMYVAESEAAAREAVRWAKVKCQASPGIFTIEEAIEQKSFFDMERKLERGSFSSSNLNGTDIKISDATHHVQGICRMSAQEHFYLETNVSLVVPGREDDEFEVFASTQNPTETQHLVAQVLGIPSNKVVVRVKRLGGGFGGKETRSAFLTCALAVAAKKYKAPVRCMLTREEDMSMTGTRHPFLGKYKVGFTDEGKLISLELEMYCNAGFSRDLSHSVLERSMTHADNSYFIPHVKIHGRMCKTNLPSNTAFRGFGGPQGLMVAETYITHVAEYLGKSVEEIRVSYLTSSRTYTTMARSRISVCHSRMYT